MASNYSAEQFEQLLKCSVCLDRLNCPKILPCQHTFCKAPCIEGLIDWENRRIRCPECRKDHFVPRNGAEGFPNNITITGFLDLPPSSGPPAAAAAATTAAITRADADSNTPSAPLRACAVCESDTELVMCFHCEKLVCDMCKQAHYGQMKMDIGRLVNQLRRGVPKLSNCISQVEGQTESLKQQVEGVKSQVRQTIETYQRELHEREVLLTSELDTFLQGELRGLRIQQENFEVELASISSYCNATESSLNQNQTITEADLVNMKSQCAEYMNQLRQAESQPIQQPRKAAFRSDGSNIHANIRHLGEVTLTTPGGHTTGSSRAQPLTQPSPPRPNPTTTAPSRPAATTVPSYTPANNRVRNSYPQPTNNTTRDSWIDRELERAMDDDYFRNFGIEPDYPPSVVHPRPAAPSQDRRNRVTGGNAAAHHPYMFRMPGGTTSAYHDTASEYWRRRLEANGNRQRVNAASIFGDAAVFEEPPEGFTDGSDTNRIPRRPHRNFDDIPVGAAGRAAREAGRGEGGGIGAPAQIPGFIGAAASAPSRSPAAFMVPMNTNSPLDLTDRANLEANQFRQRISPPRNQERGRGGGGGGGRAGGQRNRQTRNIVGRGTTTTNQTNQNQTTNNNATSPRTQQAAGGGDTAATNTTRPIRPGTVVISRGRRPPGATDGEGASTSQTNGASQSPPTAAGNNSDNPSSNQNQNNANGDITSTSATNATSSSRHVNDGSSMNVPSMQQQQEQDENDALNETLGDLLIDSEDDEAEIDMAISMTPQDSLTATSSVHRYEHKREPTLILGGPVGQRSHELAQFNSPRGIGVCPINGSIIVADSSNHRVQIFSSAGQIIHHFGGEGDTDGKFNCLSGITVNLLGDIFVADRYNNRVQVFDRYGTYKDKFGREGSGNGQLKQPWGIACDRSSFIYVCDIGNHRIQMFQEDGQYVRTIGRRGSEQGQLENPTHVAISEDNFVVVSDTNNHRIQVFSTTGRFVTCFGREGSGNGELRYPKGVAVDAQGFIVVADSGNQRVQVFRGNGDFLCAFGQEGTGPGEFKAMDGLACTSSGKIIVSDQDNQRIQVF